MAVDVNYIKSVRREQAHELLLVKVYFEHLDPVSILREERGPGHVKNGRAMKDHELTGDSGRFGDCFFVLGNMQ